MTRASSAVKAYGSPEGSAEPHTPASVGKSRVRSG